MFVCAYERDNNVQITRWHTWIFDNARSRRLSESDTLVTFYNISI